MKKDSDKNLWSNLNSQAGIIILKSVIETTRLAFYAWVVYRLSLLLDRDGLVQLILTVLEDYHQ